MSLAGRNSFTFIWTIDNFSFALQKHGERLESPRFVVKSLENTTWVLLLYPEGHLNERDISIYLLREDDDGPEVSLCIDYEISFLSSEGSSLHAEEVRDKAFTKFSTWGCPYFIKRSKVLEKEEEFLPRDVLTVRCLMTKSGSDLASSDLCCARTRIGVEHRSFVWRVDGFSGLKKNQKRTLTVEPTSKQAASFALSLYTADSLSDVVVRMDMSCSGTLIPLLSYIEVCILDATGKVSCNKEGEHLFMSTGFEQWTLPDLISWYKVTLNTNLSIPNDVLSLKCQVSISFGVVSSHIEDYLSAPSISGHYTFKYLDRLGFDVNGEGKPMQHNLSSDLRTLLEEGTFSDKRLKAHGKEFLVHKSILSARSPVFRAMFSADMKEKTSVCDQLSDLDDDTLYRLLVYLYTDRVENLCFDSATKLFFAADKYGIELLKEHCSSFLKSNISFRNVCRVLILADRHQDKELKKVSQDFCARHEAVFCTDEWDTLMRDNSGLALETLHFKYAKRKRGDGSSQGKYAALHKLRSSLKTSTISYPRSRLRTIFRNLRAHQRRKSQP